MKDFFLAQTAAELSIEPKRVAAVIELLSQGATVPFVARYRKEITGGLDEVQIIDIRDRLKSLEELNQRLESILKSLEERELLTAELKEKLSAAKTMTELEDLYLPFRPKKRTRAMMAKERGLEPLALKLMEQNPSDDPQLLAQEALKGAKEVLESKEALSGARDILAEIIAEDQEARKRLRALFESEAIIRAKLRPNSDDNAQKYRDYFDFEAKLSQVPSHRYLAIRRAESEGALTLEVRPELTAALTLLRAIFIKNDSLCASQVDLALVDSYKRLLCLSLETEARLKAKKKADLEAVRIFSENLRHLLLAPPLGAKPVLAIDPGFRTGCKLAVLGADGALLAYETIYPHASSEANRLSAGKKIIELVNLYSLKAAAVGNGTAGRETEEFLEGLKDKLPAEFIIVMVSESGASIYSASEEAREEFGHLDLTVRGAVSIGRRLMDPLAELVKIDPKSIGVGQYQHDVDQGLLKNTLNDAVESCVNQVGVEVNTASEKLLSYVSGLGPSLAKNIVQYRRQNGPFESRRDFLKVSRLGPKVFDQCAGFLRISSAANPLDSSAVHPESYEVVEKMAYDLGVKVLDLIERPELRHRIRLPNYANDRVGLPTLKDILSELEKPGRDPRSAFKNVTFQKDLLSLNDLKAGMRLNGKVTNVTAFGAFVDVGVHRDGLIHLSQLSDSFVTDPAAVVKVGQEVSVTVLAVDLERSRLELSLKSQINLNPVRPSQERGQDGRGGRPRGGPDNKANPRPPKGASGSGGAFAALADFFKKNPESH
ncbi:MAG: RNA-binding transcriptional accessory protein [Deltaproteobacteria bacterium]|nr:RNA-binding transcriptional accessory protein [Deltaproteobacteria bacterium]